MSYTSASAAKASAQSFTGSEKRVAPNEKDVLLSVLKDADLIMNDDLETAERNLNQGDTCFHVLGRGIISFLQAALGAEQDVMKRASDRLNKSETVAAEQQKKAQRNPDAHALVYPPGTEYAVCQAQALMLGAIVAVMNESLTDAIRGFYKMRKAIGILQSVATHEKQYLEKMGHSNALEALHGDQSAGAVGGDLNIISDGHENDADEFYDADEPTKEAKPTTGSHHAEEDGRSRVAPDEVQASEALDVKDRLNGKASAFESPIDQWIQATTSCQYGLMLVLISTIPPAFSRLLSIVGFHGDRDRGLGLLWRASASKDINGAIAALSILSYSNSLISFLDIKPPSFYPKERLNALLAVMRARYPQSELWRFVNAQTLSAKRDLEASIAFLGEHDGPLGEPGVNGAKSGKSEWKAMKQVLAVQTFERAINSMYVHAYELTAKCFVRCSELNTWSHAHFFYVAASSHLELYRVYKYGGLLPKFSADLSIPTTLQAVAPDAAKAKHHGEEATKLYEKIPATAGKKRVFARQLPFDVFVTRKLNKWQARAKERKIDFLDAVGVSPIDEMIFFFGGTSRMQRVHLLMNLSRLAWSDGDTSLLPEAEVGLPPAQAVPSSDPHASKDTLDERALLALLRATALRGLGRTDDVRALLHREIISHTRAEFAAAKHGESWTAPMARYEIAATYWAERYDIAEGDETIQDETGAALNKQKLEQCAKWLDEVANWGSFELEVRIGIKIRTGRDTLKQLGIAV